jgi:hypothetical protein
MQGHWADAALYYRCSFAITGAASPPSTGSPTQLGLRLTYQPGRRILRAEAHLDQTSHWVFDSVRGGT